MEGYFSPGQLAAACGVTQQTVTRWCKLGRVKAIYLGPNVHPSWGITIAEGMRAVRNYRRYKKGSNLK